MNHLPAANDVDDDLPVLTDIIAEPENEVPLLTEIIVADEPILNTELLAAEIMPAEPGFDQTEWLAAIEQKIIVQLETAFAEKLARLQQLATAQAIAEFKAELPILLREALNKETR
jgi:protein involved in temperature-dependent protein secretion